MSSTSPSAPFAPSLSPTGPQPARHNHHQPLRPIEEHEATLPRRPRSVPNRRHFFRHFRRGSSRQSPNSTPLASSTPSTSSSSSHPTLTAGTSTPSTSSRTSVRYRPHLSQMPNHSHSHSSDTQLKPIYIYPGLLRIVRDKAIALDNQCPAVLYKCRECRRERENAHASPTSTIEVAKASQSLSGQSQKAPSSTSNEDPSSAQSPISPVSLNADPQLDATAVPNSPAPAVRSAGRPADAPDVPVPERDRCPHQTSCSICLEEFHTKDLVRKLPCNINHVFHSKCILDWFASHHRCPLCNETVAHVSTTIRSVSPTTVTATPTPPSESHSHSFRLPENRSAISRYRRRMASDFLAEVRVNAPRAPRSPSDSIQQASAGSTAHPHALSQSPPAEPRQHRRRSILRAALDAVPLHFSSERSESRQPVEVPAVPGRSLPPRPPPASVDTPSNNGSISHSRRGGSHRHTIHSPQPSRNIPGTQEATVSERPSNVTSSDPDGRREVCGPPLQVSGDCKAQDSGNDKSRKKGRGPRTYSYIVHDNVRMEMNPVIPV